MAHKRYIVTKTKDRPDGEELLTLQGVEEQTPLTRSLVNTDLIIADEDQIENLRQQPHVISIEEDERISIPEGAVDGIASVHVDEVSDLHSIHQAQSAGYWGESSVVAVLDTGLDETHARTTFSGRVRQTNFTDSPSVADRQGHGTHVLGIVREVSPNAGFISVKVLGDDGSGYTSWVIRGLEWAVEQGAHIINLSLGSMSCSPQHPLVMAVNEASRQGFLIVAAAGNSGCNIGNEADRHSPGCADGAIGVAAVDAYMRPASFSSCGSTVDIAAFGVQVPSLGLNGNRNLRMSGTSMSTPVVAGSLALMRQASEKATTLRRALYAGAQPGGETNRVGAGVLDVMDSIGHITGAYHPDLPRRGISSFYRNWGKEHVVTRWGTDVGHYRPK